MSVEFTGRVAEKRMLTDRISEFTISMPEALAACEVTLPGAHIDIKAGAFLRQYSLVSADRAAGVATIAIQAEPDGRGGSRYFVDQVDPGAEVNVSAPRNAFPLRDCQGRSILIAGGIGITPICSMAEALRRANADHKTIYCARSRASAAYVDRLDGNAEFHFADETGQQVVDFQPVFAGLSAQDHIYVCGPKAMIEHVIDQAKSAGIDSARVHYELFGALLTSDDTGQAFTIKLARDGREFLVPEDMTIYDVLEEEGIDVEVSCLSGTCSTCVTRVLGGIPDHRDMVLTDEEKESGDVMTICCSRAKSDLLVLDI